MTYLVRKIERARWHGSDHEGARIKADVVASCIRPNGSELSVWFAADDSQIEDAKLAMLAAMNKLAKVDFVEIPLADIESAGLTIATTMAAGGPEILKSLHRDIADLDLDSLKKVAEVVQRILIKSEDKRITLAECRNILKKAITEKKISASELHPDLSKKL